MNTKNCPTCQAPIPANAPGGFCPACILRDAEDPVPTGRAAPSLAEVSAAFPQLEVQSLIGQGGMGFVYKVRQPSLDRTVALKILSPELSRDPAFAERFAREARVLGKLNHPNIVTVFEHGVSQPSTLNSAPFYYLLMEYVDGVNLRQAMRAGRFTPQQALAVVPGICDALQAAHAQGVWHRDIKPENILLDGQGGVKIVDFGIARIVGDPDRDFTLTSTGATLGSAAYMAPEQHEKPHDVDHRADIYSLGVVIYEMLTGELPLGRFPAPSRRAEVNARIDEIVMRTLEKERELRQQSAAEVKTDVTGATNARPRVEPNESAITRLTKLVLWSVILTLGGAVLAAIGWGVIVNFESATATGAVILAVGGLAFSIGFIGMLWSFYEMKRGAGAENARTALLSLASLLIIAVAWTAVAHAVNHPRDGLALSLGALSVPLAAFSIRSVWRAVNGRGSAPAPPSASPSSSELPVSLQPTIILHATLFALLAAVFFIVIPRFGEILRDMGVPRSYVPRVDLFHSPQGVFLFTALFAFDVGLCFLVRKIGGRRGLRQWTVAVILVMVSVVAMASGARYLPLKSVIANIGGTTSAENARRAAKPVPQNLLSRTFAVGQLVPTQAVIEIVKTFVGQEGFLSCSLAPDPRYITVTATAEQVEAVAEFLVKRIGPSVPYGRPMVADQWTGQPETFNESVSGQTGSACFTYRGEAVGYVVYSKRPAKEFIGNGSLVIIRLDQGQVFEVALDGEDRLRVNRDFYNLSAGRAFAIDEKGAVQQFPLYHTAEDLASLKRAINTRPISAGAVEAYREFRGFQKGKTPREFADPGIARKFADLTNRFYESLRGTVAEPVSKRIQQLARDQQRASTQGDEAELQRLRQETDVLGKQLEAMLEKIGEQKPADSPAVPGAQGSKIAHRVGVFPGDRLELDGKVTGFDQLGTFLKQWVAKDELEAVGVHIEKGSDAAFARKVYQQLKDSGVHFDAEAMRTFDETPVVQGGTDSAPQNPATRAAKSAFGPVVERSLYYSDNMRTYIDFQSGDLSRAQWALTALPTDDEQKTWLKNSSVDAYAIEPITNKDAQTGAVAREHPRLSSWSGGCVFALVPHSQAFDDPHAEEMEARLKESTESAALMGGTYWFKTSDGAKGIVHLYGINDSPPQVQLRYRLLAADPVAKDVESWSYTLRHIDAARLDAQMKAKPEAGVTTKVEAGVVTLTGRPEAVRPLATMLRMIDQPEVKDPLQLPLLNMPPDFFTRLAIRALMSGTEFKDSQFEPEFFESLKRENITAPQLARALSAHVLELEKATFVNTGTPFESIMKIPGASTFYDGTIPCADQPDKPLTLRIRRTTQTMGTKPDIAGLAPWLIEEAKKQSTEPMPTK